MIKISSKLNKFYIAHTEAEDAIPLRGKQDSRSVDQPREEVTHPLSGIEIGTLSSGRFDSASKTHGSLGAVRQFNRSWRSGKTRRDPILDVNAVGLNAFSINWTGNFLYTYLPTKLIALVLRKMREEPCLMLLVAPARSDLVELVTEARVQLPLNRTLFRQAGNSPVNVPMKNLHVWILNTTSLKLKGSQTPWLRGF